MAGVPVARRRFSVEEYDRMVAAGILAEDDRVELLNGEIVAMAAMGEGHADCVERLTAVFVRATGDRARVRVQLPVRLRPHSEPEPDLVLARPGRGHPAAVDVLLVIEVGDTTIETDRRLKVPLYASGGIPEVWIVDLRGRNVEVYRGPEPDGAYASVTRLKPGEALSPLAFPEIRVPLEEVLGAA